MWFEQIVMYYWILQFFYFSLIDSKCWKCKLFIIFYCEGVGIFRFFFELSFCSASIEEDMWHGCQHTGSHNKKGVVSNLVVYNATISSGWYRWWNVLFALSSHCLDLDLNAQNTRRNFWCIPGMLETYTILETRVIIKISTYTGEKIKMADSKKLSLSISFSIVHIFPRKF